MHARTLTHGQPRTCTHTHTHPSILSLTLCLSLSAFFFVASSEIPNCPETTGLGLTQYLMKTTWLSGSLVETQLLDPQVTKPISRVVLLI